MEKFCVPELHHTKQGRKLQEAYASRKVFFALKDQVKPLPGNRKQYEVKVLNATNLEGLEKYAEAVRRTLNLDSLKVVMEHDAINLVVSKELDEDEAHLFSLLSNPKVIKAWTDENLAIAVGITDLGEPRIIDLTDNRTPHVLVCGTTGSGKTTALRAILLNLLYHQPDRVNLIVGDRANDLSLFCDVPHLSYPLITDFDTLLKVVLMLKAEMERRIAMKNEAKFGRFPHIVVVIDEFNAFMTAPDDTKKQSLMVESLKNLLRMGRHAKIHFVLAAHNPTRKNMLIDTSDLPVKMAFKVSSANASVTAIGVGGAEKLAGNGDMILHADQIEHLQGAFVSEDDVKDDLQQVRDCFRNMNKGAPRGIYGFTVTEEALHHQAEHLQAEPPLSSCRQSSTLASDRIFASMVMWALEQEAISCNQIMCNFHVGWKRASDFVAQMHDLGIVDDLDAKLPRKVLAHAIDELPPNVKDLLLRNGLYKIKSTPNSSGASATTPTGAMRTYKRGDTAAIRELLSRNAPLQMRLPYRSFEAPTALSSQEQFPSRSENVTGKKLKKIQRSVRTKIE